MITSKLVSAACSRPAAKVVASVGSMRCARRPSRSKAASSGSSSTISTRMGIRIATAEGLAPEGLPWGLRLLNVNDPRHPEPLVRSADVDIRQSWSGRMSRSARTRSGLLEARTRQPDSPQERPKARVATHRVKLLHVRKAEQVGRPVCVCGVEPRQRSVALAQKRVWRGDYDGIKIPMRSLGDQLLDRAMGFTHTTKFSKNTRRNRSA